MFCLILRSVNKLYGTYFIVMQQHVLYCREYLSVYDLVSYSNWKGVQSLRDSLTRLGRPENDFIG